MDITGIANLATELSLSRTAEAVGVSVLKKAIDLESASALALIASISTMPPAALPAHVGQHINLVA